MQPVAAPAIRDEPTRVWTNTHIHLAKHANGQSLSGQNNLFPHEGIERPTFDGVDDHQNVVGASDVTPLSHPDFDIKRQRVLTKNTKLYFASCQQWNFSDTIEEPTGHPGGAPADNPTTGTGNDAFAENLANALVRAKHNLDTETSPYGPPGEQATHFYKIFGASLQGPEGKTVVLAELRESFIKFLKSTKTSESQSSFHKLISQAKDAFKQLRTSLSGCVRLDPDDLSDNYTVSVIHDGTWTTQPPNGTSAVTNYQYEMNLFLLSPTKDKSADYATHHQDVIAQRAEYRANLSDRHRRAGCSKLQLGIRLFSGLVSLKEALANIMVFLTAVYVNPEKTLVGQMVAKYFEHIETNDGSLDLFRSPTCPRTDLIVVNIIGELQQVASEMAHLALTPDLLQKDDATIKAALCPGIASATSSVNENLTTLKNQLKRRNPTDYHYQPAIYELFTGAITYRDGNFATKNPKRPAPQDGEKTPSKTPKGKNTSPGTEKTPEATKSKNSFIAYDWKAADNKKLDPTTIDFKSKDPSDTRTRRLCMAHATKGRSCRYGSNCNFFHADSINDVHQDNQAALRQWVADTDFVSFVDQAQGA